MSQLSARHRSHPRKQPSQARAHATVQAIVEATARILEAYGHDGFSTNAVAERAGVSIGTLYQYFPNKEALLGAVIARETAQLVEAAGIAAGEAAGPAALERLIAAAVARTSSAGRPWRDCSISTRAGCRSTRRHARFGRNSSRCSATCSRAPACLRRRTRHRPR